MVVTEAPVSSISRTLPESLIRALTMMAWPGVKRICPTPAADRDHGPARRGRGRGDGRGRRRIDELGAGAEAIGDAVQALAVVHLSLRVRPAVDLGGSGGGEAQNEGRNGRRGDQKPGHAGSSLDGQTSMEAPGSPGRGRGQRGVSVTIPAGAPSGQGRGAVFARFQIVSYTTISSAPATVLRASRTR